MTVVGGLENGEDTTVLCTSKFQQIRIEKFVITCIYNTTRNNINLQYDRWLELELTNVISILRSRVLDKEPFSILLSILGLFGRSVPNNVGVIVKYSRF